MYKKILKTQAVMALIGCTLWADQSYGGYKISGEIRAGYVDYDYDSALNDTKAFATILKVGIETPKYNGFYGKIMGAGVNDLGTSDLEKQQKSNIFRRNSDGSRANFNILQELYIGYSDSVNEVKLGRNELVTPMISKDDYYMFANSFETASYANRSLKDTTINAGYIHKMAGVWDSRSDGSNFRSMSDASMTSAANKGEANNAGVYYAGADYKAGAHSFKAWEYYARDLYNTVFAQYDYFGRADGFLYNIGVQGMNFDEVGKLSKSATKINNGVYATQIDAKLDNGFLLNGSVSKFTSGQGENSVLGAWGGYAYYTKGFIFHFHEANSFTNALGYKLQIGYDFSKIGAKDLSINLRYTNFLLDENYSKLNGIGQKYLTFHGAQLKYDFLKSAYFSATFEKGYLDQVHSFSGLRLIGGYKF
jgi:hypothetical protein